MTTKAEQQRNARTEFVYLLQREREMTTRCAHVYHQTERDDRVSIGYCSRCGRDMQQFASDHKMRVYSSHKLALARGLWTHGKR